MGLLIQLRPQIIIWDHFFFDPPNQGYRDVAQEQHWPLKYKIGIKIFESHM